MAPDFGRAGGPICRSLDTGFREGQSGELRITRLLGSHVNKDLGDTGATRPFEDARQESRCRRTYLRTSDWAMEIGRVASATSWPCVRLSRSYLACLNCLTSSSASAVESSAAIKANLSVNRYLFPI